MQPIRKRIVPITSELWFEMFFYLINKKDRIFYKEDRLITIRIIFVL